MDRITLRGLIISGYGSLHNFANALGWSARKVSYIVSGKQEPNASEIQAMADMLKIDIPDDMKRIFFFKSPQNIDYDKTCLH